MSYWAGPLENRYRVSQAGRIEGLTLPVPARRHQVIPYGLTRLQQAERPGGGGAAPLIDDWDAGLDVRYAI